MKKTDKNAGITLIVLAVTIIVLLILAGISISMLTGNNGIIRQAGDAKESAQKEEARELIKTEVLQSYNKLGDLNLIELKERLSKIDADVSQIENVLIDNAHTGKITLNGYDFYIDSNDEVLSDKSILFNKKYIELQLMGENQYDKTLEITKMNLSGDIIWKTSNEEIVKVENGKITPVSDGEATITVICKEGKNEYKATCIVKVESFIDDSYIRYDVEYEDVFSEKRYTKNTGWRLISQEQNSDGTYNIEFISTGVPCKLCYGWYEMSSAIWKPTSQVKNEYVNRFYDTASNRNATYCAAGLYYSFDKIEFREEISSDDRNIGGYKKIITKNKNGIMEELSGNITGEAFIAKKDAKVRNVSLADIRGYDKIQGKEGGVKSYNSGEEYADKKRGLFKLNDYTLDNKKVKSYFLSNPSSITSSYHILAFMSSGGTISSNGARIAGLRPVISMKNVNMTKEDCVWIIND